MAKNEIDARYKVFMHIQENLMDLVDDGTVEGQELAELYDSMGEVANAVLDSLGFEVQSVADDGTITASINLKDLE